MNFFLKNKFKLFKSYSLIFKYLMSWASILKNNNKESENFVKETKINEELDENIFNTDINCIENFENKHELDLFDFCFDIKDYMDQHSDILLNIKSYELLDFIKEYVDTRQFDNKSEIESSDRDSDNDY